MLKDALAKLKWVHIALFEATGDTPDNFKEIHKRLYKLDDDLRKLLKLYHRELKRYEHSRL